MLYFYLLNSEFFQRMLAPALEASWRHKRLDHAKDLCSHLIARAEQSNVAMPPDAVVRAVLRGLPFDRHVWQALVGEALIYGAADMPRLATAPETLVWLLAKEPCAKARQHFTPIHQVHFGARDLRFGGGF